MPHQPFLARFLRSPRTIQEDTQPPTTLPSLPPSNDRFDTARELVRMAMRHVRAAAGIPKDWISTDVLVLDPAYRQRLEIEIVVRHWDERLLRHSHAIERALQLEVARLDPAVAMLIRRVHWRFSSESERPQSAWPPVENWTQAGTPVAPLVEPPDLLDGLAARGELRRYEPIANSSARAFAPTLPLAEAASDPAFAPTQPAKRALRG